MQFCVCRFFVSLFCTWFHFKNFTSNGALVDSSTEIDIRNTVFSFGCQCAVSLRQRSYRMCYLNHTSRTLRNFYYSVLLLRFSFFWTLYFNSMNRTVVARSFGGPIRRLKIATTTTAPVIQNSKRQTISLSVCAPCFGMCLIIDSECLNRYVSIWFSDVRLRCRLTNNRLNRVWKGQFNLSRRHCDGVREYCYMYIVHVPFLLLVNDKGNSFSSSLVRLILLRRYETHRIEAICARILTNADIILPFGKSTAKNTKR